MSWRPTQRKDFNIVTDDGFVPADAGLHRGLSRTRYPYSAAVQDGLESNVVMAPIHWITRNFTEAMAVVQRRAKKLWREQEGHALAKLLRKPNQFYSGSMLWKATLVSALLDGNGYWRKLRNRFGEVVELWYLPHFSIEPKWPSDGSVYISHYQYRPQGRGTVIDLDPRDVTHLRYGGLDPENTRKGLSPVRPILREVFTDEEASNFAASILRNMGVPGGVMAPKDVASAQALDGDQAQAMKDYLKNNFTGDQRGDWFVSGVPMQIEQFGFDPNQLMLGSLRDIAEERVCAMLGIPPSIVGFGAGLQQTKVGATQRENRQSAWHNCIIPLHNDMGEQVSASLLPDFVARPDSYRVYFDRSGVSAFEEDKTETARRAGILAEKGIITVAQAQAMTGEEVDERMRFYLLPSGAVPFDGEKKLEGFSDPNPSTPAGEEGGEGDDDDEDDDEEVPAAVAARMNGTEPSEEE